MDAKSFRLLLREYRINELRLTVNTKHKQIVRRNSKIDKIPAQQSTLLHDDAAAAKKRFAHTKFYWFKICMPRRRGNCQYIQIGNSIRVFVVFTVCSQLVCTPKANTKVKLTCAIKYSIFVHWIFRFVSRFNVFAHIPRTPHRTCSKVFPYFFFRQLLPVDICFFFGIDGLYLFSATQNLFAEKYWMKKEWKKKTVQSFGILMTMRAGKSEKTEWKKKCAIQRTSCTRCIYMSEFS